MAGALSERHAEAGLWVAVPVAALAVLAGLVLPDSDAPHGGRFHYRAATLLTAGLVALVLVLAQGGTWGWGAPRTIALAVVALVALSAWVVVERRSAHPLVSVRLLSNPRLALVSGYTFCAAFGTIGFLGANALFLGAARSATGYGMGLGPQAIGAWDVTYLGKPSHAALAPWEGVNALDALTVAHTAIGLLRQQLPPGVVVHGIVTDGGQAVNVIPARTRARCEVRAPNVEQLATAWQRVRACFEAGALATGTELQLQPRGRDFADLRQDPDLTEVYAGVLSGLGRTAIPRHGESMASTDMGNVSQLIPTIHPTIGYDTGGAQQHTPEFTAYGKSAGADRAVLDGATALALTAVGLATSPTQRSRLLDGVRKRQRS